MTKRVPQQYHDYNVPVNLQPDQPPAELGQSFRLEPFVREFSDRRIGLV
jgi:hypothetical protein